MNDINYNRLLEQFNTINHDFNKLINKYDQNDFNLKNEIKKLKELNETLKKKYKDKNYDEIKSNEISKKDNEDKNNEINKLNKELQKDNKKLKKDNKLLKKDNDEENNEINELNNKLKDNELLKKDNEKLKKNNGLLKKDNEDKDREINELKNKLKENESSEKFKKENESLKKENESLKKENELLKKENEKFKKDNESLKKENEKFKKENESLKKENEKFKKDNESLKKYEDKNNINNNLNISDQTNYNLLILSSSDPLNLYENNTSSSNFNDSKMNDYKNVTPNYSCYINSDNDLVIEIELVGFKNCKLSYEIINNEFYNFHIIAEKENDEIEKKMILNKRINENIDYIFKIPIDSFTFSESKPYFKKFEKGLITFKYKLLNNNSSISIKFNDINIPK